MKNLVEETKREVARTGTWSGPAGVLRMCVRPQRTIWTTPRRRSGFGGATYAATAGPRQKTQRHGGKSDEQDGHLRH